MMKIGSRKTLVQGDAKEQIKQTKVQNDQKRLLYISLHYKKFVSTRHNHQKKSSRPSIFSQNCSSSADSTRNSERKTRSLPTYSGVTDPAELKYGVIFNHTSNRYGDIPRFPLPYILKW